LIALTTNLINLLICARAGRKRTLLVAVILIALSYERINWVLVLPLLGAVLYYFPTDLKARGMMGDAVRMYSVWPWDFGEPPFCP
jgi:hypothetical protein